MYCTWRCILATTVILILAANTAFAGFPRLGALMAKDGYLPRQLTYRGSRLVYRYGIVSSALIATVLVVLFQASVTPHPIICNWCIHVFHIGTVRYGAPLVEMWKA